jgi:hypothetical protein
MSSSDKPQAQDPFPDWSAFSPREAPDEIESLSPAAEAAGLLQRYYADLAAARQQQQDVTNGVLRALAKQAMYVFQFGAALERYQTEFAQASLPRVHRHLRVLKDQMLDGLYASGLEIDVPLAQPFETVADVVNVDGWRHETQFTAEVVAEVSEPIVRAGGTLIRPGRVVMGAPVQPTHLTEPENESRE